MSANVGLSPSQSAIYMDDLAYPESAINTVGFRIHFPKCDADQLEEALNNTIDKTALFTLSLETNGGEPFLKSDDANRRHATRLDMKDIHEVDELWSKESISYLRPELYKIWAISLADGGSAMIMLFHHILIDGYTAMQIAQMVLNELDGRETDSHKIDYSGEFSKTDDTAPLYDADEEKSFWLNYMSDVDAEDSFMRGEASSCDRLRFNLPVPKDLEIKINEFELNNKVKDAAVFSAALSIWLSRTGQTKDALFLMPRLNRENEKQLAELACRTLVIPVRVTVEGEEDYASLCRQSTDQARLASKHKQFGMKNILDELHMSGIRNGSVSNYVLNCTHVGILESDKEYDIIETQSGGMDNHLTVCIQRYHDRINIMYDARVGIYDEESTKRFHDEILHIIEQGITDGVNISDIEIVAEEEKNMLLDMKGDTVEVSDTDSIPDLFKKAVDKYPDKPALYAGDVSYTFAELDIESNRIANALIKEGVQSGDSILYKLNRDYRLIPTVFGILKAGAAFIPIDPTYPESRIDYILRDSGSKVMIVSDGTINGKEPEDIRLINIDDLLQCDDTSDPGIDIPQSQLAYSIYTSGTTGNPKGVMLSHKGIVNITHPDNNPFNKDIAKTGKGIVAIGSVSFDISLYEFFVPLFNGCFIELAPENALADPKALAALLKKHGANIFHCTPSRILAYLRDADFKDALKSVDCILAAGEALPASLVVELKAQYDIRIYNGYGPTETTIGATITEAGDDISIGKPIANMGVMLLDSNGRMVPFGTCGEIFVYGNGVGIGYRNLEEETKKRFVEYYGRRLYKTGDIGRFLPDGRIEYHGRNDFQVKLRGLRIELSEIENRMLAYAGVSSVCVQVRNIHGREHLVGFYTLNEGKEVNDDEYKNYLKMNLPSYMVPDVLKKLDDIPRTPGGKTDLKKMAEVPVEYVAVYRAPETDLQEMVCEVFEKVLNLERAGIDDNFFEVGGDSLHTAEFIYQMSEAFPDITLNFEDIFKYPTPEMLAQHVYRLMAQIEGETVHDDVISGLDYDAVNKVLTDNVPANADVNIEKHRLGNVLLTGASGFLGLHVLMELLKDSECYDKVYCLIRPTKRLNPEKRLKSILFFFENQDFDELIGNRVFAVGGDISKEEIFDEPNDIAFDTIINCAADVSHYAYGDKLDKANTKSVNNLMKLAKRFGAELVQVSTISVGGCYDTSKEKLTLPENALYIGQEIHNQYALSKYMAEYNALKAMADGVCNVKIMRVGNLQGRLSDGEFQIKKNTNAFTRQIVAYVRLGMVPESLYNSTVNFSPVDEVARMIVNLSMLPSNYTVFHVSPEEEVPFKMLFDAAVSLGYDVKVVSDQAFEEAIKELKKNKEIRSFLEAIFAERMDFKYSYSDISLDFTSDIIKKTGLKWGEIKKEYIDTYMRVLDEFGVFGGDK